jgi:hypothetical protein
LRFLNELRSCLHQQADLSNKLSTNVVLNCLNWLSGLFRWSLKPLNYWQFRYEFMIIAYFIAYFREIKVLTFLHRYASDIIFPDDHGGQFWSTWIVHKFQGIKKRLGKRNNVLSPEIEIIYINLYLWTKFSHICFSKDSWVGISVYYVLWNSRKLLKFTVYSIGKIFPHIGCIVPLQ